MSRCTRDALRQRLAARLQWIFDHVGPSVLMDQTAYVQMIAADAQLRRRLSEAGAVLEALGRIRQSQQP